MSPFFFPRHAILQPIPRRLALDSGHVQGPRQAGNVAGGERLGARCPGRLRRRRFPRPSRHPDHRQPDRRADADQRGGVADRADPRRRRRRAAQVRRSWPARLHLRRARKPPRPRPDRDACSAGGRWSRSTSPDIARHLEPLRATFDAPPGKGALLAAGRAVAEALAPGLQARLPDPRVQRIIDFAAAHLEEPLSLAGASAGVHLSPSRLRHLFVEQTGLAFKTYLLWLRLVSAVALYAEGNRSPKRRMPPAFPIPPISAGSSSAPSACRRPR